MKAMTDHLPKGWTRKRIDELGQLYSGSTPSTHVVAYWGDEIVWVTPNDLSKLRTRYITNSERRITEVGLRNCSAHLLPKGSLIISSRAPIGYLAIAQTDFCTNQGCKSLVFSSEQDPDFHYYNLSFRVKSIKEKGEGTTFAEISKSALAKIEVPVPVEKAEQTAIADILSTVDQAIAQTEALIAKQRRIKAGLLHDLLTRGIDEHGNLRDPATHRFKESPMGLVPEEWEVKGIGEIAAFVGSGVTPTGGSQVYGHEGIIFIRSQNVHNDGLILDDVAYIDEAINRRMWRTQVFSHDVLLNITGASIGRCCFVPDGFPAANVNQHVCIIRQENATAADTLFLSAYIASPFGQKQIKMLNAGGNREGLNYQQVKNILVPYPNKKEREEFACILQNMNETIENEVSTHAKHMRLKTGLMQDLLSGRVRT